MLESKVAQNGYTGGGLTMEDNMDIVSGWDCTTQDTEATARLSEEQAMSLNELVDEFSIV